MNARVDLYQQVTDRMIAALEAGTRPWQQDWASLDPLRANGQRYRGINVLLLAMSSGAHGFTGQHWMTFKQAKELGGSIRKGERGTHIVFFKSLSIEDSTAPNGERSVPVLRGYTVFNVDQVDGLPAGKFTAAALDLTGAKGRDHEAEGALLSCGATIRHGGERAYYSPADDYVQMPDFERFFSTEGYLATMAHELAHWTGHTSRLDRAKGHRFASRGYAFEELIAEMGAAFIGARLGFSGDHLENHAAYLASWLKVLKDDKRAIFTAASAAQAAADMVLANAGCGEATPLPASPAVQAEAAAQARQMVLI